MRAWNKQWFLAIALSLLAVSGCARKAAEYPPRVQEWIKSSACSVANSPEYLYLEKLQDKVFLGTRYGNISAQMLRGFHRNLEAALVGLNLNAHGGVSDAELTEHVRQNWNRNSPTCYQDEIWYGLMGGMVAEVERVAGPMGYSMRSPAFGTLPTNRPEFLTTKLSDEGRPILALGGGLFTLTHEMTKVAIETFPTRKKGRETMEVDLTIDGFSKKKQREAFMRVYLLALEHVGVLGTSEHYNIKKDHIHLVGALVHSAELFAVAHLMAHHYLGHPLDPPVEGVTNGLLVTEPARTWRQELDADRLALEIMVAARRREAAGEPIGLVLHAPVLFLGYLSIIDDIDKMRRTYQVTPKSFEYTAEELGTWGYDSPVMDQRRPMPHIVRKIALRNYIAEEYGEVAQTDMAGVPQAADRNITILWDGASRLVHTWIVEHRLGSQPAESANE